MDKVFETINGKDEQEFLEAYSHDIKSVSEIGLEWKSLIEIHDYYKGIVRNKLEIAAQELFLQLKSIKGAHTVKYRIKDPEHLIDKIIRKKIDDGRLVTKEYFLEEFDDFIGFRILHLFKTDWEPIFISIKDKFVSKETPVAYHRDGDDPEFLQRCKDLGLEPKVKEAGYRSIHYIGLFPFFGSNFKCEIQIRTLFEEAWSEIDHLVRYPNNTKNELLNTYLLIFNKLAGCADEMGTFLMVMKSSLTQQQNERSELENIVVKLKEEISGLKLTNSKQKERINELIKKLDDGVTVGWYDSSVLHTPSTLDYITQIQNPSGLTVLDSLTKFQDNLGLINKEGYNPLQNSIVSGVEPVHLSNLSTLTGIQPDTGKQPVDYINGYKPFEK